MVPIQPFTASEQKDPRTTRVPGRETIACWEKYEGATILAAEADKRGCLFVVELSERCEGWNLPWLNDLREKVILHFGVCKGCQVGLCDHKGKLLSKGWRLCGIPHSSYDLAVFE